MELSRISLVRVVGLASVVLVMGLALIVLPAGKASAAPVDCTLTVSGPFFYAEMVFPVVEVTCDSVKKSIRIDAALDMDGERVATSSRTCRRASSCVTGLASDGIFAIDEPGDQLWCGKGLASIRTTGPVQFLPVAGSCESESF